MSRNGHTSYFNGFIQIILLLNRNFVAMKYFRNVSMFDYRGSTSQGLWWRNDKLSCWDFSMKECILDGWGSLVTYTGDKWISLTWCAASAEIRYAGTETECVNIESDLDNIMITFISKIIESNVQFLWLGLHVHCSTSRKLRLNTRNSLIWFI